jgi:hypothetical protein
MSEQKEDRKKERKNEENLAKQRCSRSRELCLNKKKKEKRRKK